MNRNGNIQQKLLWLALLSASALAGAPPIGEHKISRDLNGLPPGTKVGIGLFVLICL